MGVSKSIKEIYEFFYRCSEDLIDWDDILNTIPTTCDMGEIYCRNACYAMGRKTGTCEVNIFFYFFFLISELML